MFPLLLPPTSITAPNFHHQTSITATRPPATLDRRRHRPPLPPFLPSSPLNVPISLFPPLPPPPSPNPHRRQHQTAADTPSPPPFFFSSPPYLPFQPPAFDRYRRASALHHRKARRHHRY
nr:formin-like protein 14 [Arachis hypogaea]